MAKKTFNFPFHKVRTTYPESTTRVKLGNSWEFVAAPKAPDQRIFELTMRGMQYFVNKNGSINKTKHAGRNMALLEDFYREHQQWKSFYYDHPVHGTVTVRFMDPLDIPAGIDGGSGVVNEFQIRLIELP